MPPTSMRRWTRKAPNANSGRLSRCSASGGLIYRRIRRRRLDGSVDSVRMDLEEKTIEKPGERCEVCGAKLTPREIVAALESGGPSLCMIHAAEVDPCDESV